MSNEKKSNSGIRYELFDQLIKEAFENVSIEEFERVVREAEKRHIKEAIAARKKRLPSSDSGSDLNTITFEYSNYEEVVQQVDEKLKKKHEISTFRNLSVRRHPLEIEVEKVNYVEKSLSNITLVTQPKERSKRNQLDYESAA